MASRDTQKTDPVMEPKLKADWEKAAAQAGQGGRPARGAEGRGRGATSVAARMRETRPGQAPAARAA